MKDVGIDLVKISRFENASEALVKRVLSPKEIELFNKESDSCKASFMASRFASKEAYFKATQDGTNFNEISVLNDKRGKPYIEGHDEVVISLSDEDDYVIAIVMVK